MAPHDSMAAEAGLNAHPYRALSQRATALLWGYIGPVSHGARLFGLGLQERTRMFLLDQRGENILGKHLERQISMLELRGECEGLRGRGNISCGDSFSWSSSSLLVEPKGPGTKGSPAKTLTYPFPGTVPSI